MLRFEYQTADKWIRIRTWNSKFANPNFI